MRDGAGVYERAEDRGASASGGEGAAMFLMTDERLQCLSLPFPACRLRGPADCYIMELLLHLSLPAFSFWLS